MATFLTQVLVSQTYILEDLHMKYDMWDLLSMAQDGNVTDGCGGGRTGCGLMVFRAQ